VYIGVDGIRPAIAEGQRVVRRSKGLWAAACAFYALGALCGCSFVAVANGLPEGRAYELVSPLDKGGNEAGASKGNVQFATAAADGERVVYGTSGPVGSGPTGIGPTYAVSERTAVGWQTRGALPRGVGSLSAVEDAPLQRFYPSPNLADYAFATLGPYVTGGGDQKKSPNLYLTGEDTAVEPSWVSQPTVSSPFPALGQGRNKLPAPAGPPTNGGRLYFTYYGTLVPEDAGRAVLLEEGEEAWGFYESNEGRLAYAGRLPDGSVDAHGAVPAATGERSEKDTPDFFANQVSDDGSRAFFVSPDPQSSHPPGDPVELYVREGGERTVLVSRNTLEGDTPAAGYEGPEGGTTGVTPVHTPAVRSGGNGEQDSYVYALPDGSRAYFESKDKLATSATGGAPTGAGPWTYEFNLETNALTYLPGVDGRILASSQDGSRFIFIKYSEEAPGERSPGALYISSGGNAAKVAELPAPPFNATTHDTMIVSPVRATPDGSVFVFETDSPIPGARNSDGSEPANNGEGYEQIYRYEAGNEAPWCLSCPPKGTTPNGNANLSSDDHLQEAEYETSAGLVVGNRGLTADGGQVFFDTPESLVASDSNGVRDAYQWAGGRLHLVSSGTGSQPSFFLDNSESGRDVFFATSESLTAEDTDGGYDVYDARIAGGFPHAPAAGECGDGCQGPPSLAPTFPSPASAIFSGAGNVSPAAPASARKLPTRAEKLARALRACRKGRKNRRRVCETQARRKYGSARRAKTKTRRAS